MLSETLLEKLKTKRIYSIEGNIGAGKTTILNLIGKTFQDVEFVEEPVSQWQNLGGMNLLEKFYEYPDRWGFSFEFYVMLSKLKALSKSAESSKPIIILERSLFSNKIFIDISYSLNKLNDLEYHMLMKIFDFFIQNVYPILNGVIYLKTPVEVCYKRINLRHRGEESAIDKDYLGLLHGKFEQFAGDSTVPTIVINGEYDLERDAGKVVRDIKEFLHQEIEI